MIKATHLTKRFGEFTAIHNLDCAIPHGCIYGLVGSNGAGKSTFLRLAAGVYQADEGTLTLSGQPVFENPSVKSLIAFIPDDVYFLTNSNLDRMAAFYSATQPNFDYNRYRELTELFRLNRKKAISTLSKGMRRQAAMILALASRPEYIFMDETFDGLDPVMRGLIKSLLCSDVSERKSTAIITSHSLRELEDTCDQLALLHKGGIILQNEVENLKTSLYKVQIAFAYEYSEALFAPFNVLHCSKSGSVSNLILRGDEDRTRERLRALSPILMEFLPLTLEEVFTYEMETLGYSFHDVDLQGGPHV